eukprot:5101915-Pleurochrysis_carterae.AAC.2
MALALQCRAVTLWVALFARVQGTLFQRSVHVVTRTHVLSLGRSKCGLADFWRDPDSASDGSYTRAGWYVACEPVPSGFGWRFAGR